MTGTDLSQSTGISFQEIMKNLSWNENTPGLLWQNCLIRRAKVTKNKYLVWLDFKQWNMNKKIILNQQTAINRTLTLAATLTVIYPWCADKDEKRVIFVLI